MEQQFYKGRLSDRHGLETVVPGEAGRELVHGIISVSYTHLRAHET